MEGTYDRRKRIRRLKKIILGTIAAAIVIPVILSLVLGIRVIQLQNRIRELEMGLAARTEEKGEVKSVFAANAIVNASQKAAEAKTFPENTDEVEEDINEGKKQVYLTFDDGPSANTDAILDILREYNVKATFFVVAKTDELSTRAYQKIVSEGHTLAMHSYSHKYEEIYDSKENFIEDVEKIQEYLFQVTGVRPVFYRFPGGSANTVSQVDMQELISWLNEKGITYFDWNIASGDAVSKLLEADTIVENCVSAIDGKNVCIILMHDAKNRSTTVEALPRVIETIMERGDAVILPITDETVPIQQVKAEQ
ncbi:MAG: polysaccharide deacetylase [Lachnospiraceae bacterium]|nr:polysaccharide deacetylase [Lachnospiraceae bacterium]